MRCNSCKTETATRMRFYYDEKNKSYREICDQCGNMEHSTVPDVYFKGRYFDEHLTDEKHPHGQYIESRRHKAKLLKKLDLREAGGDKNSILGRPAPFIKDPVARQRFFRDNYGR